MVVDLNGQVALVTGAARGIGRAIALQLAEQGVDVAVADIDLAAGHQYGGELTADSVEAEVRALGRRAIGIEGDLTDRNAAAQAVARTVEDLGRIDILVVAAGGAITPAATSFAATATVEDQQILFGANFTALVNCCQEAAVHLRAQGSGSIINVVSQAGTYVQADGQLAFYGAAKAAAINYTRALAAELGADGVRVNALAPGLTWTPRVAAKMAESGIDPAALARHRDVALQRWGTAEDIAKVALFLASDLSGWVTGQCISANGGQLPLGPS